MRLKSILTPFAVAGLLMATTGCDDADTTSYMPTFSGFEYETPVKVGDSLVVVAKQSQRGKLISTTEYKWVCIRNWYNEEEGTSGRDTCAVSNQKVNYYADPSDPTFKFYVPANTVSLAVSFDAAYTYAGQGPSRFDGSNTGDETTANGYIRPVSSNMLFGRTRGAVNIRLNR